MCLAGAMTPRVPLGTVPPGEVAGEVAGGGFASLLARRRSTRAFGPQPLGLGQLALLAWAAQGRTASEATAWDAAGTTAEVRRTCPSAHAMYPLTLTVIVGSGGVDGLAAGVYDYESDRHALTLTTSGDHRGPVAATTLADGGWLRHAPALLLLSGDLDGATRHFADQPPHGHRGARYVWLEAGHASQNVYLQAAESGLGAVLVAGFDDDRLAGLTPRVVPPDRHPLALLALGHPAAEPDR